jgi:curved DNA-binding protein CbpA
MKWTLFLRMPPPREGRLPGDPPWAGRNHYQLLGLDPSAEPFLVEAAYRAQMRRRHPDRGGDTAHAQAINEAYRVLRNAEARARYDEALAMGEAGAPQREEPAAPRPAPATRGGGWTSAAYLALGVVLVVAAAFSLRAPAESAAQAVAGLVGDEVPR